MRSFLTYGLISLVGVAALYACGDDSGAGSAIGGGGTAGVGGSAGAGGGGAGTAGAGGGGGGTSVAGSAGSAGAPAIDVSPVATCTGCVELIVPVNGANSDANLADQASFQFTFPAPGVDFSNGVITWHVQAPQTNDNFTAQAYAQNGAALTYANVYPAGSAKVLSAANFAAGTFTDIVLDLSAYRSLPRAADAGAGDAGSTATVDAGDAGGGGGTIDPGAFDKSKVESIGLQLRNSTAFTGTGTIRVAVDGVDIVGVPGQTNHTFNAGAEGLAVNNYQVPPGTPAPVVHQ